MPIKNTSGPSWKHTIFPSSEVDPPKSHDSHHVRLRLTTESAGAQTCRTTGRPEPSGEPGGGAHIRHAVLV